MDGRDLTLGLCEELEQLAPFGLGNPGVTLLVAGSELSELSTVGEGKHLRLAVTRERLPLGRDRLRLGRAARPLPAARAATTSPSSSTRTTGTARSRRSSWSSGSSRRPTRYDELRARLAAEWRAGPDAWSPQARQIFEELGLVDGPGGRRSLAESPTFRAALAEQLAAAARPP